jgi:hypothetical protein
MSAALDIALFGHLTPATRSVCTVRVSTKRLGLRTYGQYRSSLTQQRVRSRRSTQPGGWHGPY